MNRLPPTDTERIDRGRTLGFEFCGRRLEGFEGDTVASALWGAGIRVLSRSFEYHRPRGLYDLEGEGSGALVSVDGVPNQSAGTRLLGRGMRVEAQNVRGSPARDPFGVLDRLDAWMPAGFYYRLFHRPYGAWPFFQNRMRAMAGLGRLDIGAKFDVGHRPELYLTADIAVIGGGPAGLAAALAAAETVERVCLFEARPWLGGRSDWRMSERDGGTHRERGAALAREVADHPSIRVFTGAPVTGVWGENLVTGFQVGSSRGAPAAGGDAGFAERHWECRATAVVAATGVLERPLVFENNDRPGVIQADTAWRLARHYGVQPGETLAFSTADDLALEAAADLAGLGVPIAAVADARLDGHDAALLERLRAAGVEVLAGWTSSGVEGRADVEAVELSPLAGGAPRRVECDTLVASAGRQPELGVLSTAGARFRYSSRRAAFVPQRMPPGVFACGRLAGLGDAAAIEASGAVAGLEAAAFCGGGRPDPAVAADLEEARARLAARPGPVRGWNHTHGPGLEEGRKAFLDFDEDGTWKNAVQAGALGFDVPELAKRFANFGLGPGQYRVPGQNLAMAMAEIAGTPVDDIEITTVRPPIVPPAIATLAGSRHHIRKRTPLHEEMVDARGVFRQAGPWLRARWFGSDPTCVDEIRNVRTNVGLLDSSPLGKFRLFGPDALNALQRVYISDMRKVAEGRCTYSAMLNDTGNIVDDGVVTRVGPDDYYLTTSSNRAGSTVEWFRYHTRYDGWDYNLVNLTDALASINIAGPNSRDVLRRVTEADVSNDAFPYMGYREMEVGEGVAARCLRLGFVGELSYELHFPASYSRYVWELLLEAGARFGIRPFGLEAQYCMRAEKGHVIIGAESEQRVTLTDIGMGWMWDRDDTESKKVGAPALRACERQPGRLKLVGLRMERAAGRRRSSGPADGALVVDGSEITGYVCTTRDSEALGWRYGLALVRDGRAARGRSVELYQDLGAGEERFAAMVVPPHFYDPDGVRLRR